MNTSAICLTVSTLLLASCAAKSPGAEAVTPAAPPAAAQPKASSPPTTLAEQGRDPAEFPAYVEALKQQARSQGISDATITAAFANVHFVDRVIKSDQNQLEKKVTLDDYLARVITPAKIEQARALYQQYQPQLTSVSARTGVQSNYIVALWAMESNFGKIQGKEDIVSALSTLAFEGRREAFFTKELMASLKILDRGHVSADELKGSWAGAMGQNQFMPSSYLRYGKDGDGDGKIDIWSNTSDVFASTANYLATEGWEAGGAWGTEVRLPEGFNTGLAGTKTAQGKTVSQWQKLGVTLPDGLELPASTQRAWIVTPDDNQGRSFLVYNNFRTIMRWNRSYYFAISIGTMADAIAK
ncbi:lytic murein transglycosylase [Enterobacteriaceae bacterium H18W14]|uniref:lytic murein transglycosylase n=1 Tax=Dryocola boscaweniae TaxID=2925397 RepID=UPI0022F051B8|nr:lytic murein transglycosylase [Dryocola boscaweniae]MCT4713903.1 lytic murein transglycosylase [Dryocola boscaweniae]